MAPTLPVRLRMEQQIRLLNLPFTGPKLLRPTCGAPAYLPSVGGLYAIMIYDATCRPLPYRSIYMGETGNLAEGVCQDHENYELWERVAGGAPLYVAFHPIDDETARRIAERLLIEHYGPECNTTFNRNALALRALLDLYSGESNWPFNL
jgi:hypothetical protein